MRAPAFFGVLAIAAAVVCFALGAAEGRAAGAVLLLAGACWLLSDGSDE